MSFDLIAFISIHLRLTVSIPFDQGDVFRLNDEEVIKTELRGLNPFRSGRCLSTQPFATKIHIAESQSLSIRAMSFDGSCSTIRNIQRSLNPFRSGRCLSTKEAHEERVKAWSLNPFRSGRCLSTRRDARVTALVQVSIPFDQGDVFRLQRYAGGRNHAAFQTHFPIFLEG